MLYWNIEAERMKKGFSKSALADLLGVTVRTYLNWQKNGNIPSSKLIALSDIFGCSVDFLLQDARQQNRCCRGCRRCGK